jgi:hypothetical protein
LWLTFKNSPDIFCDENVSITFSFKSAEQKNYFTPLSKKSSSCRWRKCGGKGGGINFDEIYVDWKICGV